MQTLDKYFSNLWFVSDPVIAYRVLRGLARALILRKNTLKTIEVFPTMQCNLTCIMCSIDEYRQMKVPELAVEDWERVAREGARLGAMSVNILGGEPLIHKGIDRVIAAFRRNHYYVYMVSNSLLATEERLRQLKRAGLGGICFSLDSLDEQENDRVRNLPGHFKKVMNAVRVAKEVGLHVAVAPVFFPGQVARAADVVRFARDNGISASGTQVAPVGAWDGDLLSTAENDQIRQMLKDYPHFTVDWSLSYFLKQRCPAGKEKIGITHTGDVIGCSINQLSFGNVRDESLATIHARMGRFSAFKADSPVCLAAESTSYVDTYIRPMTRQGGGGTSYKNHPAITPESEPELFR